MATRRPIVLVSGVQAEMPRGDVIDTGLNVTLQPNPSGLYFTGDNKLGFDGQGDNIQVTASGAGAVYRTVESKLQDVVSVKDFGAVGDGVADDTAAIQAAINSITSTGIYKRGTTLEFPTGNYKVSNTIYVNTNIELLGTGDVSIVGSMSGKSVFYLGDASYLNTNVAASYKRIVVNRINFTSMSQNYAIQSVGIRTVVIENCTFFNSVIAEVSLKEAWATSKVINNWFQGGTAKALEVLQNSNAILISGNRFAFYTSPTGLAVYIEGTSGAWIQNNDFEYSRAGILIKGVISGGSNLIAYRTNILNNWIEGNEEYSIKLDNSVLQTQGISIKGNSIYASGPAGNGHVVLGVAGSTNLIRGIEIQGNNFGDPSTIQYPCSSTVYQETRVTANAYTGSLLSPNISDSEFIAAKSSPQSITANTATLVTFENATLSTDGRYASSKWTPPIGTVLIQAGIYSTSTVTAGNQFRLMIYKNGSELKRIQFNFPFTAFQPAQISIMDRANGTDFYEVYVFCNNAFTVSDTTLGTYFSGHML